MGIVTRRGMIKVNQIGAIERSVPYFIAFDGENSGSKEERIPKPRLMNSGVAPKQKTESCGRNNGFAPRGYLLSIHF